MRVSKSIGDICDIICGQDYKSVQDANGKYPIYGTGGIMGYASQSRCPANSIIIGRKGSINNPLFVQEAFWNVDTAFGVVPNTSVIVPKYFFYFCRHYDFTIHDVSVTLPSLRRSDIVKIQVPVPSLEEQERIVAELDLLTGIIDKQKAQLKDLDALAQSIFYDMFGNPDTNEKEWDIKTIGDTCSITCGQDYKNVQDENGKYPIFGTGGLMGHANQYRCPKDSIIIGRKGNINNPIYVAEPFWNVDTAFGVTPNNTILNSLFFYYFCLNYDFTKHDVSVTIPSLRRTDVLKIKVPIPPIALQKVFSNKISSIEQQKESINCSISETQKLFDYTMDKYFG